MIGQAPVIARAPLRLRRLFGALAWLSAVLALPASAPAETVTLFAAASTTDAVEEVAEAFAASTGGSIRPVVAASSTLARQIAQGAPADIYLSANVRWMDYLDEEALIDRRSRMTLLSNRLVLTAPSDSDLQVTLSPDAELAAKLGDGRLAIGDPAHVPAGIYAQRALEALGLWQDISGKLAQAANVRAALALVERGEALAGIVYETDAAISERVKVIDVFPAAVTPEISYPLAIVAGRDSPAVRRVYDFLQSGAATAIFRRHGFTVAPQGS
ncbi:molybdate ABC transporter substrate-binding protein [Pelagibius sp.]|uniref:molybdate ABC transporter substrate-binding protein n=1 Tax=Pelagibius sp. TaxID=1931238 RepID=UPI0026065CE1|nr:molybdate ABC transporter substrate-binding protein [Pelagibius sp.]